MRCVGDKSFDASLTKNIDQVPVIWKSGHRTCAHDYIVPALIETIKSLSPGIGEPLKILDIGCGYGYIASKLAELGHVVIGVDESPERIDFARLTYPKVSFGVRSVYDDELAELVGGPVDCVIALEVIEHLFRPRSLLEQGHRLLRTGGHLVISAPYHGYLKNLAISLANGWDEHFRSEFEGDHIKFFSKKILERMVSQTGFRKIQVRGLGRLPWLWKSMILVAER